jgi:hypothetical protein
MVGQMISNRSILKTLLTVVVFCCGITPAFAAEPVAAWCEEPGDPNHPLSFEAMTLGALLPLEIRTHPTKAVQAISDVFEQQQNELELSNKAVADDPYLRAFREILEKQIAGENRQEYFRFTPGDSSDDLILPSEDEALEFDCENETPAKLMGIDSNPQKANIGYAAYLVTVVLSEQLESFDKIYSTRVEERAGEYERYLKDGLAMWPWELAVNGWGQDYNDLFTAAPRWQWVVARPSAGFEIVWPNRKEARLEASIGVEPLGFVRYTDSSYKNWWGLSTLVVLGTDDNGAGLGGLIRYNNYSLGIVKREDIDDPYLCLSFDLYGKLEDTKTRISKADEELKQLKQS